MPLPRADARSRFAVPGLTNAHHVSTDPGGKFLFVANSFDTKVNMFAIDPVTGALTKTADGNTTLAVPG